VSSKQDKPLGMDVPAEERLEPAEAKSRPVAKTKAKTPEKKPEKKPAETEETRARQSVAPFCPYHKGVRTKSNNSTGLFTRYYCPEEGCQFSVKIARPNIEAAVKRIREEEEDFSAR